MFCKKCGQQINNGANVCSNCGTKVVSEQSIKKIFNKANWSNENELNNSDCFVYNIPEDVKSEVRQNFGIEYNEQVLFVRDTSFWNSRNQGLVLTDGGIYCIPDNEKADEKIFFTWSAVKQVEYKDLVLYFWGYEEDNCPIHISYFMKSDDSTKALRLGKALAQNFTEMAQSITPEADPFDMAVEQYDQLYNAGKRDEALQFALSCARQEQENMKLFYTAAAHLCMIQKDYLRAISICNEGLNYCEYTSRMAMDLLYAKYSAFQWLNDKVEARKYCLPVMLYAPDDLQIGDGVLIKEDATNDFGIYEKEYVSNYLTQSYAKRKVLLPVKEYTNLDQEHLSVIDIKKLPNTHIEFPIGHPVAYQLYIGHPYISQKYIPFENYELELIEDKVREFCQIVQKLGATEITIECVNSSSSDNNTQSEQNISGNISYKIASASGSVQRERNNHLIDEISQSINLHQKFTPKAPLSLPDNLVWYPNEPSWQRLYEQRLQGTLLQHEERIETRKNRVLESSELNSIEGEFKSLFMEAKGHWNKNDEEKFTLQENAILSIQVHFISLEELQNEEVIQQAQINNITFTENERIYLEEFQICLEEASEISARERRLLDKFRIQLNISEDRAKELEESLLFPKLAKEELEYLEEYKACIEDGEISPKEQRLLDKLRIGLGISDNRAKEIEYLCNHKRK